MRIVIITTRDEWYHQYLCVEIAKRHNVIAVLHPMSSPTRSRLVNFKTHRKQISRFGFAYYLLRRFADNRFFQVGWNWRADVRAAEQRFFADVGDKYEKLVAPIAQEVPDINGEDGVALVRELSPDVVVCSGGPIYRSQLIESVGTMLNYHTGISPIYNGAYTVFWTYANRQPHMTGGTLMRMSQRVDGGDVLGHYLPPVAEDDTPGSLFMKTMIGGVAMYNRVLDHHAAYGKFLAVPQGAAYRTYYDSEWTAYQTLSIDRFIRQGLCKKHVRDEIVREYFALSNAATAREEMKQFLSELIYHE